MRSRLGWILRLYLYREKFRNIKVFVMACGFLGLLGFNNLGCCCPRLTARPGAWMGNKETR